MRIAILTRHFSRSGGGAESYAIAIAQALAARHEVHVFCQESDRPIPELHYHPVWRLSKRPRWLNQLLYSAITAWRTRTGFDIVHSHEHVWHGDVQTLHVRCVWEGIFGQRQGLQRLLRWLLVLTSLRRLTYLWLEHARMQPRTGRRLIFASAPLQQEFLRQYPQVAALCDIIPPAVTLPAQPPDRAASRAQLGWSPDTPWLLFVANDYARKGLDCLLQALTQLPPEVQLAVVGQNHQQARYQAKAQALGLAGRVHFFGPQADLSPFYAAADGLAHPTLEDSFGMVVLEAMAYALPVVVSGPTHCGLSTQLTSGVQALLLDDPQNPTALASALAQMLKDTALRARLREAGLALAREMSWTQAALKYERNFEASLRQRVGA